RCDEFEERRRDRILRMHPTEHRVDTRAAAERPRPRLRYADPCKQRLDPDADVVHQHTDGRHQVVHRTLPCYSALTAPSAVVLARLRLSHSDARGARRRHRAPRLRASTRRGCTRSLRSSEWSAVTHEAHLQGEVHPVSRLSNALATEVRAHLAIAARA